MKVERKICINAPIETTFQIAETYPLFVESFRDKEILWRNDQGSKVRITNTFFLFPLTWEGESRKEKNKSIHWVQTSGLLNGLHADWIFSSLGPGKTEVSIRGKFSRGGFLGFVFDSLARILIVKAAMKILASLKQESERQC